MLCSLCRGRPRQLGSRKRPHYTQYQCIQCGIYLCIVVKENPYDNVQPPVEGELTSCWNLWHNSKYTIPHVNIHDDCHNDAEEEEQEAG